jgi:type IV pilus assembly protein PilN
MRGAVSINLASDPFRRDRPYVVAAMAGAVVLVALLVYQVALGWIEGDQRRDLSASIARAEHSLTLVRQDEAQWLALFRKPENAEAADYAVFLNGLITRKAISWSRIFSDLERVIPHNVRLLSVRPQVNLDNQILLDMTVASAAPEPVVDMLMRLEGSPLFGATNMTGWVPPSQSDPLFRYRVNVNYAPQL